MEPDEARPVAHERRTDDPVLAADDCTRHTRATPRGLAHRSHRADLAATPPTPPSAAAPATGSAGRRAVAVVARRFGVRRTGRS